MSLKREIDHTIQGEIKKKRTETDKDQDLSNDELEGALGISDQNCYTPNQDERCMLHIGGDIYVVAKKYNDKLQVHIRQFTRYGNERYPSKKGVTLSLCRWRVLESIREELDSYFKNYYSETLSEKEETMHLGGGIYATVNDQYPVVNLRHWWKPEDSDKPVPTKRGIILNKGKWIQLMNCMSLIRDFVPELHDVSVGCTEDHQNQQGMLRCGECNPFENEIY